MVKPNLMMLEKGEIQFFCRHKVVSPTENTDIHNQDEIQHLYFVLNPEHTNLYRLLIIGKKELPSMKSHESNLVFVDLVTHDNLEINKALQQQTYKTITRGQRLQPEAYLLAKGHYSIIYDGKQTLLCYDLKNINTPSRLTASLNLASHGKYILSVKNPDVNVSKSSRQIANYPAELKKIFKDLHFIPANPIDLINYNNAQLVLIGID